MVGKRVNPNAWNPQLGFSNIPWEKNEPRRDVFQEGLPHDAIGTSDMTGTVVDRSAIQTRAPFDRGAVNYIITAIGSTPVMTRATSSGIPVTVRSCPTSRNARKKRICLRDTHFEVGLDPSFVSLGAKFLAIEHFDNNGLATPPYFYLRVFRLFRGQYCTT